MTVLPQVIPIADRVLEIARTDPNRVALTQVFQRRTGEPNYRSWTYAELSQRAESLAVGLRSIGVHEGTLCSFMVPPSFDAMVLGVALWRVGAVTVGIEPHSHGLRLVAKCLAKVGPEVFFGTPEAHVGRVAFGWGRGTVHTKVVVGSRGLPGMPTLRSLEVGTGKEPVRADVAPEDIAVIAFTTGSTGQPKPTVLRQRNVAAMIDMIVGHWGFDVDGGVIDMPTFPMFWIIGLSAGGTVVIPPMDFTLKGPGDADPARLLRTINDCGVRSMFGSPALLTNLADHAARTGQRAPTLERIVAGGAEVAGPLFAKVKAMLGPDGEMYSDYGATEALPVAEIAGDTVIHETWPMTESGAGLCVGTPLPGVEVRIVAVDEGVIPTWADATELPTGEIGEIVARSPHISEDYFRQPQATAENKIHDGDGPPWHRLGDTGYVDAHGRLWACGRRSHRVYTADGVAYPLCVEPVFNAHPDVARSALVALDDGVVARAVVCVERRTGYEGDTDRLEAELLEVARQHESTKLVERIVFVDRLPVDRRHNAKIDRPQLSRDLSRGVDLDASGGRLLRGVLSRR
jgi:acyl-CoA synthetase (AMP-forming)/AMP-acid ligase II